MQTNHKTGAMTYLSRVIKKLACLVVLIICSLPFTLFGQERKAQPKEFTGLEASKKLRGAEFVKEGRNTSYPSFVRFNVSSQVSFQGFIPWLKQNMKSQKTVDFKLMKQDKDELGFDHYRYVQTFSAIPIDKTTYIVHVKANKVVSFNGLALDVPKNLSSKPKLTETAALQHALKYSGAVKFKWDDDYWMRDLKRRTKNNDATYFPNGELCWHVADDNKTYRLAYKFDIHSSIPDKIQRIYVDASTGELLKKLALESNCNGATVNTIHNGNRSISTDKFTDDDFRLRDNCQSAVIHIRDWNSNDCDENPLEIQNTTNTWTSMNERFGATVLWQTKQAYLYWLIVRSRNSYDNGNGDIDGYINAVFSSTPTPPCTAYTDNASMSFTGGRLKVGLGSSNTLGNSWSAIDILGHEFTHAVTGSSAELEYQNESGALNESFSDIFGEATENYVFGSNDWLMGEERDDGAIRDMSNPNAFNDPDTYLGTNWYSGSNDAGGVHTNSGVQNFWFYLLTAGGSGTNDNGDAYTVSGLGLTKASAIAARNLTLYLGATSGYSDARTNAIQAAIDLYGACSNEVKQTTNAWYAVGVGAQFIKATATVTSNYNGRDVSCANSCDGTASVSVISGNAPTYSWSTGATTQSISNLCPGTYTVTVTDLAGLGCTATSSVTIDNTPALGLSIVKSNHNGFSVSCHGSSNGTATANPTGGTPPYSYSWSNGQHTKTATGLSAITYNVTVTDANGCIIAGGTTLTEPASLTVSITKSNYHGFGVSCNGSSDGTATANVSGGVGPFNYAWSNGQSTVMITGLSATTYSVLITDANGCTATNNTTLTEPSVLTLTALATSDYNGYDVQCTGGHNGVAEAFPNGGVPAYAYAWSNGQNTKIATGLFAITYHVTVTDLNGCTANASTTLTEPPALPVASITVDEHGGLCNSIALTAHSSTTENTYAWNDSETTQTINLTLDDPDGIYSVFVTDLQGCTSAAPATYDLQKQNHLNYYTVLGLNSVSLGKVNNVESGSVGVKNVGGTASFDQNCSVAAAGAFVKADNITVQNPSNIPTRITDPANIPVPAMQYNDVPYPPLNILVILPGQTITLNSNYSLLTIGAGAHVTLNGNSFGSINISPDAVVTFTQSSLNIDNMLTLDGYSAYTTVKFTNDCNVKATGVITLGQKTIINPDGKHVMFFMANAGSLLVIPQFAISGNKTTVNANIMMPNGRIKVTGGANACHMNGVFIAKDVLSLNSNVVWNGNDCDGVMARNAENTVEELANNASTFNVVVAPNPSSSYFTVKIETAENIPVSIRIADVSGRVVEEQHDLTPNGNISVGAKLSTGSYFAEITQGNNRQVVKLIKLN